MEQNENTPQKQKIKKGCLIGGIAGLAFFILLIALIAGGGDSEQEQKQEEKGKQTQAQTESPQKPKSPWTETEQTDEMTNEVRYFKKTESLEEIEFSFPYNGGSTFFLTIRGKENQSPDIYLSTNRGQFMPGFGGEYVRLKFDDEEPFKVTYNSAADGSSDIIFLKSESKILKKLATAKELKVEAPFFEDGRKVINFNVEGFTWDH